MIIFFRHPELFLENCSKFSSNEIQELLAERKNLLLQYITSENWTSYFNTLPNYSQITNFHNLFVKRRTDYKISDEEYWRLLRILWINNGQEIFGNRHIWYKLFFESRLHSSSFMSERENYQLKALPENNLVYRGMVLRKHLNNYGKFDRFPHRDNIGLSYTLSKDIALFYKEKYSIYNCISEGVSYQSTIQQMYVKKKDIFAYVTEKEEAEILILSNQLKCIF